eukprot:12293816-Alexandrium_andersonii.AAC.1
MACVQEARKACNMAARAGLTSARINHARLEMEALRPRQLPRRSPTALRTATTALCHDPALSLSSPQRSRPVMGQGWERLRRAGTER